MGEGGKMRQAIPKYSPKIPKTIGGFWDRKYQGQMALVAPQRPMMPFPTE